METFRGTDGLSALAKESGGWELAREEEEQEKESWARYFRLHAPDTRQVV